MKLPTATLLTGLLLASPGTAWAQSTCQPEFVQSAQNVNVPNIVVGLQDFTVETFQVRIRNASGENGPCRTTLRVARLSVSTNPHPAPLRLQARDQMLEILPRETSPGTAGSDLRIAQVPGGSNGFTLPFQLAIASGWGTRSGTQIEDLLLLLVDELGQISDVLPLTIRIDIPPAAEVRVVGATGNDTVARIDLGELDPGAMNLSENFGIRVWSTSAYTVRFESQNRGALVHSENRGRIPYELLMDQKPVSVVGGIAAQVPQGTEPLGDFHPLSLRVRPFTARAGFYADRVEVTVTAS